MKDEEMRKDRRQTEDEIWKDYEESWIWCKQGEEMKGEVRSGEGRKD